MRVGADDREMAEDVLGRYIRAAVEDDLVALFERAPLFGRPRLLGRLVGAALSGLVWAIAVVAIAGGL